VRVLSARLTCAAVCLLAAEAVAVRAQIPTATLTQADKELQNGQADQAIALLSPLPTSGTGADVAQNLLCRVRFTLQQWAQAVTACQAAINLNGQNSDYHMWLGRVLGQQASHSSIFSAYGIAKHSLSEMQTAVQLNPKNGPALSDLGDYYAQAPSIAGGGADKAQGIATQLDKVDAVRAAQLRGDIAMAQKDYTTAEQQYKQAVTTAKHAAHEWTVLASFYKSRKDYSDMETAIQSCVNAETQDKATGVPLYDGAGVLVEAKQNPQQAEQMLETYLAGSQKSEEAPAFVAYGRLANLKKQLGDSAGAQQALSAAAALAREYTPPKQDSSH
jgi:tetratricopeptide (TPR) repeat protein